MKPTPTAFNINQKRCLNRLLGDQLDLTVTEGKHRMVRSMLANCGHPVIDLQRLRFGALVLGDLPAGAWRVASAQELLWATALR